MTFFKSTVLALFALLSQQIQAQDESVTVIGERIYPDRPADFMGGSHRDLGQASEIQIESPHEGGAGLAKAESGSVGGYKVGDVIKDVGKVIELISKSVEINGRIKIKIETKDGTKIEIEIEAKVQT